MAFDPNKHLIKLLGNRQYLPVSARLIWFREQHPDWGIDTSPLVLDVEKQVAVFEARVYNEAGRLMAKGTKMEDIRGFPDYIEKAETGAIGRALAVCGFGTQFAPEFDELASGRFVDSPQERRPGAARPAPSTTEPDASEPTEPPSRPVPIPAQAPSVPNGGASPGPHLCSACGRELTQSQEVLSVRKYGAALCPACQKGRAAAEAG
ncbi:MAG: hypothetical protein P4L33_17965 [Capsulimonadaceae bacterium]|nr:hypothetical protein [Capsulimonadaceae bacterium]